MRPFAVIAAILLGTAVGASAFTLFYAEGASYLGDDPTACANCHIMNEVFEGWVRGPHHAVAACNDCHAPNALLPKYLTKAENGLRHSLAFTFGGFPEPIRITDRNRRVTEGQCRTCHEQVSHGIDRGAGDRESVACNSCHSRVGHF